MSDLVRVEGLSYQYPDGTAALRDIRFTLRHGERVALLGPNGSGKTTLALHLNGLLRGTGTIHIDGLAMEDQHLGAIRRKVGLLLQDPDEQLFLPTVADDVSFGPRQLGWPQEKVQARTRQALEQVGLAGDANRPPYHLSAGQKQRAALAGLLAMDPALLVLDEPTTHLDPPARRQLAELLRNLPQAQLLVTHDVEFARALAPRALFFEAGHLLLDSVLEEVIARTGWESKY